MMSITERFTHERIKHFIATNKNEFFVFFAIHPKDKLIKIKYTKYRRTVKINPSNFLSV